MNNLITISEYSSIRYEICNSPAEEGIDEEHKCIKISPATLAMLENLTTKVPFLEIYHSKIRTLNYAGVAMAGTLKIEILPKFFKTGNFQRDKQRTMNNLLYMLNHSDLFNFKEIDQAALDVKNDFLEVIIFLFAKNLFHLLKNQQDRQYIRREDDLHFVREKIITSRYISNPARLHIIPCRFHERSMNTLLNQTLKFTAYQLSRVATNSETTRYLKNIISLLDPVDLRIVNYLELKKIPFNRLNMPYHPYIKFCDLFLRHLTTTLQASQVESFSLMIPMEKLFEDFITTTLIRYPGLLPQEYRENIQKQKSIGYLAYENGQGFFEMRPDIVVYGRETVIIDTKYKMLDASDVRSKISQQDLYQMYVYCRESGSNIAVLLYPEGINEQVSDRLFHFGETQSIALFIRSVSLDMDLSTKEGFEIFRKNLKKSFEFLHATPLFSQRLQQPNENFA